MNLRNGEKRKGSTCGQRHRVSITWKHGKFSGEGLLSACPVLWSKIKYCWINPTSPTGVFNLNQCSFSLTRAQRTRMFEVQFKTRFPSVLRYIISKYTLQICVTNKNSQSLLTATYFLKYKILTAMSSLDTTHKNQHKKIFLIHIYCFFVTMNCFDSLTKLSNNQELRSTKYYLIIVCIICAFYRSLIYL